MSQNTFLSLCHAAGTDPAIALEDDNLRRALLARNDDEVRRILAEDF